LPWTRLSSGYIDSGRTFCPLLDVKSYAVTFIEGLKTGRIDSTMVHKYIRSVFLLDESKTFVVIKPLHSSVCHDIILLSKNFNVAD